MNENNQKDLVLSINEYAFILDETKGRVSCLAGPAKTSLSNSDRLVIFNPKTKSFEPCSFSDAKQLYVIAPENWYIALKNPAQNNQHPIQGAPNDLPANMEIGRKINVRGPASFALWPGQMARVIQGHALRSNQYLLARVYDADKLNTKADDSAEAPASAYVNGQILVIKGTEISFYIPPTGIEVIPINNNPNNGYVREAVTLERLEYCILKDEDGNKRYVHGPKVVFPEPTEQFVTSPKGGVIFRAVELSKISGIYVKVIAEYDDTVNGKAVHHPVGEELFITGDTQMIYYPRPEHAIITYDGKMMHHAIAIPEGEGRYIMNRLTGEIRTVKGPQMYLPDPRYEVVVKRKLSARQCKLMYPGNEEALAYNQNLNERAVEKSVQTKDLDAFAFYASNSVSDTLANLEAKANISRGTSYTKPRTITLDSKYEGVVTVDVWTGYAVNVISKNGNRQVVCGPQTIMLDYDQNLETLELSTGKPKTTDNLLPIVFLRYENDRISDIINVETSDFVKAQIKVSYLVNFDISKKDKWFSVDNYVKHLTDWARSVIKKEVKKVSITELCDNYHDIVVNALSDVTRDVVEVETLPPYLHKFEENGMEMTDVEILSLTVETQVQRMLDEHQMNVVSKALELNAAQQSAAVNAQIIELNRQSVEIAEDFSRFKAEQSAETERKQFELSVAKQKARDEEEKRRTEAEKDLQALEDAITAAKIERDKKRQEQEIAYKNEMDKLAMARENNTAAALAAVMQSIGPELAAAMNNENNQEVVEAIASAIAPYAVANGMPVAQAVSTILRGTTLETVLDTFKQSEK